MKAVWSFWSKPFAAHRHGSWASEKHHLSAWVLSTMQSAIANWLNGSKHVLLPTTLSITGVVLII